MKELSKDWEWKKLRDIAEVNDRDHRTPKYLDSGVPLISPKDFTDYGINFSKPKYVSEEEYNQFMRKCNPKTEDILYSRIGTIGESRLITTSEKFVALHSIVVIKPKRDNILPRYLLYLLKTEFIKRQAKKGTKSIGTPDLGLGEIKNFEIPVPPLPIQQKIVSILEKTDSLKQKREQANEEANKIIQSIFYKMFGNLLNDSENTKTLGDVCSFVRGPFGGSLKKEIFQPEGYAVYEQQHAIGDDFTNIRYFISGDKFNEMKRFELLSGDLIMSCSGTMGKVAIVPNGIKKGIINQALLKLTPNKNVSRIFLRYYLESKSFQDSLKIFSQGAAIQNVASVKILKEIKISLPPHTEQIQFEKIVDRMDSIKQKQSKATEEISTLFDALMQKAFNGELT